MKSLTQHISEKLVLNNNAKVRKFNYHPKTPTELKELIKKLIEERGEEADLNDIDISEITDMTALFKKSSFNGDISNWDVSNVKSMGAMFAESEFNGDISKWDVSNVWNMSNMFMNSKFTGENGDISKWDVSKVTYMSDMFSYSKFNGDISKWDVSKVESMQYMFYNSEFNRQSVEYVISDMYETYLIVTKVMFKNAKYFNKNISTWKINKNCYTSEMFMNCPIKYEYRPKF